jgi:hypothetical protein
MNIIQGTPTVAGGFTIQVVATDNSVPPLSVTNSFQLTIFDTNPPPVVLNPIPAQVAYLDAAGGLPAGLVFDDTSLTITGTPQTAGESIVQIVATDNGIPPLSATNQLQLLVTAPIRLLSIEIPSPGLLSFQLAGAGAYLLQTTESLTPPVQWRDLGAGPGSTDGWVRFATPLRSNAPASFFRVMIQR